MIGHGAMTMGIVLAVVLIGGLPVEPYLVTLPPGMTVFDICVSADRALEGLTACFDEQEEKAREVGRTIPAQCQLVRLLTRCIIYNVSITCPAVYQQFYNDLLPYVATYTMLCGDFGMLSIPEFTHLIMLEMEKRYLSWVAFMSTTEDPGTTESPDRDITTESPDRDVTIESPDGDVTTESPNRDVRTKGTERDVITAASRGRDVTDEGPVDLDTNGTLGSGKTSDDVILGSSGSTPSESPETIHEKLEDAVRP